MFKMNARKVEEKTTASYEVAFTNLTTLTNSTTTGKERHLQGVTKACEMGFKDST